MVDKKQISTFKIRYWEILEIKKLHTPDSKAKTKTIFSARTNNETYSRVTEHFIITRRTKAPNFTRIYSNLPIFGRNHLLRRLVWILLPNQKYFIDIPAPKSLKKRK